MHFHSFSLLDCACSSIGHSCNTTTNLNTNTQTCDEKLKCVVGAHKRVNCENILSGGYVPRTSSVFLSVFSVSACPIFGQAAHTHTLIQTFVAEPNYSRIKSSWVHWVCVSETRKKLLSCKTNKHDKNYSLIVVILSMTRLIVVGRWYIAANWRSVTHSHNTEKLQHFMLVCRALIKRMRGIWKGF